jgi:hypothetical protein
VNVLITDDLLTPDARAAASEKIGEIVP